MHGLKHTSKTLVQRLRTTFGRRYVTTTFAGHVLTLDTQWEHEHQYLNYIERSEIHGALAMDIWVFSHFVRPGHTTLDAGANIGFTALLAERAGATEVHCFEPDPRLVERLTAHVSGKHITVHPLALGEKPGSLRLCLSAKHNQGSTASETIVNKFPGVYGDAQFVEVDVGTIDGIFGNKRFDLLKIDVEGSELATLKGAIEILQFSRPAVIYVEIYDELFDELHAFLKQYYEFSYRIACDRDGRGRLYQADVDVTRMEKEGIYVMPPSYIYSVSRQEELGEGWTPPFVADAPS